MRYLKITNEHILGDFKLMNHLMFIQKSENTEHNMYEYIISMYPIK